METVGILYLGLWYSLNIYSDIEITQKQMGKCSDKDTIIKIRNKKTGEVLEMTFEEFYKLTKS